MPPSKLLEKLELRAGKAGVASPAGNIEDYDAAVHIGGHGGIY